MKKLLLLALLFNFIHCLAQKPGASIDVIHYAFSVSLNDADNTIDCSALIRLKILKDADTVTLDLSDEMKVASVKDEGAKKNLDFIHQQNRLFIVTKASFSKELNIKIVYSGVPKDGLIISKNKFGRRTFFSDHWPNRAHNWLPCIDHPADKASVEFIITAPVKYQVVSNGIQVEESNINDSYKLTHWKEERSLPIKIMGIGVAEFAVAYVGNVDTIPVYSWVFPENKTEGFSDYSLATGVLPYFIKNIGPYPFQKLANIQSKTIFGGMENAGAIFYAEKSVTGLRKTEQLMAHEIAHQWFGDMATEADWPHLWLSEGFATYMELLFLGNKYGNDTLVNELKENREKVINFSKKRLTPVVDTSVREYMQLLNANSYEKGGWVLHMLKKQLGDSIFWRGIRKYYNSFAGKNAETDDFRQIMEQVSGKDLKKFFKQWLYNAGHPVLKIERGWEKGMLTINIIQMQASAFEFPLKVKIDNVVKVINIKNKETRVTIPFKLQPSSFIVDPETELLFEGI